MKEGDLRLKVQESDDGLFARGSDPVPYELVIQVLEEERWDLINSMIDRMEG